ncbi:hypothetical protein V1264_008877 [Littorina saxatilis]|uniref:Claudin n=1 Tax=Littorina saxatilis TaxID=31220 RepID=A0AAN9AQE1_9CAEN
MGFTMPAVPAIVAIGCAGLGLLLQIVGVATDEWSLIDAIFVTVKIGLWTWCSDAGVTCGDTPHYLLACRAFGIIGVLLLAGCALLGVLMCFRDHAQTKFSLVAGVCGFAAGLSICVEFAVYADQSPWTTYGNSFYLTIVACVLAVVAGVCYILSTRT